MPEQPIVKAMAHIVQRRKGAPYKPKDTPKSLLRVHLEIFPMMFALGSADSKKKSTPRLTVDRSKYSGPTQFNAKLEPPRKWCYTPPSKHSISRSRGQEWEYLLNPNKPGPLFCESRGKLLVIAAGNHALVINFSLEAHVVGMPRKLYDEIISNDIPGADQERGESVRSFQLPSHLTVSGSSKTTHRTVNIHAAFVSDLWVWAIVDFTRFLLLHVISRDRFWEVTDFQMMSLTWPLFFNRFKGGPDWAFEPELAAERLDIWRQKVINRFRKWKEEYLKWKNKGSIDRYMIPRVTPRCFPSQPPRIGTGFRPQHLAEMKRSAQKKYVPGPAPLKPNKPIINAIMNNNSEAFSGYGRYSANDFLYELAIFPTTPSHIICRDTKLYNRFKTHLHEYMARLSSRTVLDRIATIPNRSNPFTFNEKSNRYFLSTCISIFHRRNIKVQKDLYDIYASNGYFNSHHIIGDHYHAAKAEKCNKGSKMVPVYIHRAESVQKKFFSIFEAQSPAGYVRELDRQPVDKDISEEGYKSTIGPAQFHERLINRVLKLNPARGRPKKEYTGKRGRPARLHSTRHDIQQRLKEGRKTVLNGYQNHRDLGDDSDEVTSAGENNDVIIIDSP